MTDDSKIDNVEAQQARMVEAFQNVSERSQRIAKAFMDRQATDDGYQVADPVVIGKAFMELASKMLENPQKLVEAQASLWQQYADLWSATAQKIAGEAGNAKATAGAAVSRAVGDKRFKDDAWNEDALYDFIKQSYLLASDWIYSTVRDVDGLDRKTREKVDFYTRQYVDALSPTNFVPTNPKVMRATLDSGGENLVKGFENLLRDLEDGQGKLRIAMTDTDAFTLGENVAVSPGKVVYQNELMQLIQYAPSTGKVARRPLLIVPPWINKFYVLDLQPDNSLIKWAVDQGHTVFVISWVNPDEKLSHKTFDDYLLEGPLAALDAMEQATGEREANVVGYCIGGTLVACMLSYMAAKGDDRVCSATFLTTMTDFAEPGELGVFIDEEQLDNLEEHMNALGFLEGRHMSQVFNMMRDNDLIWSFVVNNYLLGRDPIAFDLLYWNSDNTRMPAMMHGFYLREMYLNNKLKDPGALTLLGEPVDLTAIKTPVYMLSTADDHIAPWKSTYAATQLYSGPKKFVLSASGHIAGVVNPPAANKYCYWTNRALPADPDAWRGAAKRHEGSWWTDWQKWVKRHAGGSVSARNPGDGALKPIEDAPGAYVKARAGD